MLIACCAALVAASPATAQGEGSQGSQKGSTLLIIPPANQAPPAEHSTFRDRQRIDPQVSPSPRRRTPRGQQEVVDGYRAVLDFLSSGRREQAMQALYELETAIVSDDPLPQLDALWAGEVEVVRWLAGRDLESVVPLLAMHHDAYRVYVERHQPYLAGHSSRLAASLADLYARERGTAGARLLASRALASLGVYAQQMGARVQAMGLLLQALELEPTSAVARLGAATIHERSANYHRAAEHLLVLLEAEPQHREGRLRMAVNLARLGSARDSERLLRELVAEEETDWVAVVAYQELARTYRRTDRLAEAQALLIEAVERFPADGRLRTQLAFVLDFAHEPQRALAVIQDLGEGETGEGAAEPSPRRRYGMGPQAPYDEALATLADSAVSRLPRLVEVINGIGADRTAGGAR